MEFKSVIYQEKNVINAVQLYRDIEAAIKKEKDSKGMGENDRLERSHPLQHVLNSTSGGYVSPTVMKSFELCPGGYLAGKLFVEKTGSATSVGRTFHTIMQRFYDLPVEERDPSKMREVAKEVIKEDEQFEQEADVWYYIDGYLDAPNYETGRGAVRHDVQCANELFIKPEINPLGVSLGVPAYTLLDRLDVTESGLVIIDYKTGKGDPNPYLLGEHGYLPQFIFYKWAAEAEYGEKVRKALMSVPGAYSRDQKWVEMNVNSLVEQSKVVEQVYDHLDHIRRVRESLHFETSFMRYCGSCPIRDKCYTWLMKKGREAEAEQFKEAEIEITIEVEDKVEEESTEKVQETASEDENGEA